MALTLPKTADVTIKMERLAQKKSDLFQLNLTLNILGSYTVKDSRDSIFEQRNALQKEIEQIEYELKG
jgi:hypothetical protein